MTEDTKIRLGLIASLAVVAGYLAYLLHLGVIIR
jgi:hypothetical protein